MAGGGGFGGEELNFGEEEGGEEGEENGAEGANEFGNEETQAEEFGGEETKPEEFGGKNESIKKMNKLLTEEKIKLNEKLEQRRRLYRNIYTNRLLTMLDKEKPTHVKKVSNKTVKINESVDKIIGDINNLLEG